MSVQALTWAFAIEVGQSTRKLILIALADYADDEHRCWPSQAKLAARAECSVDTVQRHLDTLEAAGLIRRESRGRQGGGRGTDMYVLAVGTDSTLSRKMRGRKMRGFAAKGAPAPTSNRAPVLEDPPLEPSEEKNPRARGAMDDSQISDREAKPPSFDDGRVRRWDDGRLELLGELRAFWLAEFGGDATVLNLALTQAAAYVQPHGPHGLEVRVSAQLARQCRERRDCDRRYAAAAAGRQAQARAASDTQDAKIREFERQVFGRGSP
jgi:hypothetical protein